MVLYYETNTKYGGLGNIYALNYQKFGFFSSDQNEVINVVENLIEYIIFSQD